jgi:hypothetical protein
MDKKWPLVNNPLVLKYIATSIILFKKITIKMSKFDDIHIGFKIDINICNVY